MEKNPSLSGAALRAATAAQCASDATSAAGREVFANIVAGNQYQK
jgi:hypothetical protein